MPFDQFLSLLQHSSGRASRSTALQPLNWLILTLVLAMLGCLRYSSRAWICGALFGLVALGVCVFLSIYVYLAIYNVDATRSEKFTLEKLALQQGRLGDDHAGFETPVSGRAVDLHCLRCPQKLPPTLLSMRCLDAADHYRD
jgi:hypothetical protein